MRNETVEILERKGVRPTSNRILVASTLLAASRPLSLADIELKNNFTLDKSSIFRVLTLFKDHDVVHAIDDGSGSIKYELCTSHDVCMQDDRHVHFHCEECHKTFCLDNIQIPNVEIPAGYIQHSANFVIQGICPDCAKKK